MSFCEEEDIVMASLFVDPLCCQEDHWDVVEHFVEPPPSPATAGPGAETAEDDGEWLENLTWLVSREVQLNGDDEHNQDFILARAAAGRWAARARAAHGFSAATLFLALSYLDRCFAGGGALKLRRDRPWMGRLAAVACVSLAAKVEETWVPHPLDLQSSATAATTAAIAGDEEYLFEAKTIRRMELLVLSALQWRMNSVTPLTIVHHLIPKLFPKICSNGYLLQHSESALLSVLLDWRWVKYKPSVWAAAALLHAATAGGGAAVEIEDTRHSIVSLLNISKEEVEECYNLISEAMSNGGNILCFFVDESKRKNNGFTDPYDCSNVFGVTSSSYPRSPDGVLSSCFSCESSSTSINGDLWPCSVTSSPQQPLHKKPRAMEIK